MQTILIFFLRNLVFDKKLKIIQNSCTWSNANTLYDLCDFDVSIYIPHATQTETEKLLVPPKFFHFSFPLLSKWIISVSNSIAPKFHNKLRKKNTQKQIYLSLLCGHKSDEGRMSHYLPDPIDYYYFFIFQIVKNPVSRRNLTYSRCESFLWIHRKYLYTTWNCDTNKLIISPFHLTVHMMISKSTNFPHLIDKDFYSVQKKRKKKKNKSLGTNSFIKPYRLLGKMRFILFSSDFTLNIWL